MHTFIVLDDLGAEIQKVRADRLEFASVRGNFVIFRFLTAAWNQRNQSDDWEVSAEISAPPGSSVIRDDAWVDTDA